MNPTPAPSGTALLRVAEAGVELRLSRNSIYRLINTQRLKVVYVGDRRAVRIRREDLQAYIAANTAKTVAS